MMPMPPLLEPRDEKEICDAVEDAAASDRKLEIVGGGSKRGIGNPARETLALSTAGLDKVIDYDPAELVLTVEPGVRLAEIETLLAGSNQMLAFEPYDFGAVTGGETGRSTIGGVVGAGVAGSRRVSAGGVRDHLLGFSAVNGRGEAFKAGGRVVKNVTGYDLSKLMAGSWGQLAVLTEMTLKVLPRPLVTRTLVMSGLTLKAAGAVMGRAMQSQAEVAAASHVPGYDGAAPTTAIRIEGFGPSVEARARMLTDLLSDIRRVETLKASEAEMHWSKVRDASLLAASDRPSLWRICVPPARGAALLGGIATLDGEGLMDWAGGLVWARMPLSAPATFVRKMAEEAGGHAMLVEAPEAMRTGVPATHPEPAGVAAVSRRVREAFDPSGVFDPARFVAR
jgi:glycolate oxidase FAD binding subunit